MEEISDRVTRMDIDGTPRSGMILEAAGGATELAVAGGLGTDEATVEDGGQAVRPSAVRLFARRSSRTLLHRSFRGRTPRSCRGQAGAASG